MTVERDSAGQPAPEAAPWRDRDSEVVARFRVAAAERLRALVGPALIAEHRRSPVGPHSPALALVLAYLRQAPVAGKLVLHALEPRRRWAVLRLSGVAGVAHERIDDRAYDDRAEAEHAVFIARLADLGVLPRGFTR